MRPEHTGGLCICRHKDKRKEWDEMERTEFMDKAIDAIGDAKCQTPSLKPLRTRRTKTMFTKVPSQNEILIGRMESASIIGRKGLNVLLILWWVAVVQIFATVIYPLLVMAAITVIVGAVVLWDAWRTGKEVYAYGMYWTWHKKKPRWYEKEEAEWWQGLARPGENKDAKEMDGPKPIPDKTQAQTTGGQQ